MTAKAALCKHLLAGEVLNIKNCFTLIGLTNCPREISRMIEKPFLVKVTRTRKEGNSRYGQPVSWVNYKLNHTTENAEGIKKMTEYLLQQDKNIAKTGFKTDKERRCNNPQIRQSTPQQTSTLFNSL